MPSGFTPEANFSYMNPSAHLFHALYSSTEVPTSFNLAPLPPPSPILTQVLLSSSVGSEGGEDAASLSLNVAVVMLIVRYLVPARLLQLSVRRGLMKRGEKGVS